jgi:hypothetical protein
MQTACYKNNTIHSVTSKDIILYNVFKNMIPPLTEEELAALEENLLSDGCIDPLIVWAEHHILLDGHNRKAICDRHGILTTRSMQSVCRIVKLLRIGLMLISWGVAI